jgi:hypothetical protein
MTIESLYLYVALMVLDVAFVIDLNDVRWLMFGVEMVCVFCCVCALCLRFLLCVIKRMFHLMLWRVLV